MEKDKCVLSLSCFGFGLPWRKKCVLSTSCSGSGLPYLSSILQSMITKDFVLFVVCLLYDFNKFKRLQT